MIISRRNKIKKVESKTKKINKQKHQEIIAARIQHSTFKRWILVNTLAIVNASTSITIKFICESLEMITKLIWKIIPVIWMSLAIRHVWKLLKIREKWITPETVEKFISEQIPNWIILNTREIMDPWKWWTTPIYGKNHHHHLLHHRHFHHLHQRRRRHHHRNPVQMTNMRCHRIHPILIKTKQINTKNSMCFREIKIYFNVNRRYN